jgi:hypothetical protein
MPTTSIFDSTSSDEIGTDTNSSANAFNGHILWCQVKDGTTIVSHFDARLVPVGSTTVPDGVNTWAVSGLASIEVDITSPVEKKVFDARASNVIDYDNDGADVPTTGFAVIGEGEGNNQFLEYIQNTQGQIPLWEEKFTVKDQSDRTIILDEANLNLAYNAHVNPVYSLKLDPTQEPSVNQIKPGMQTRLVINHGFTEVDDTYFVGTVDVHLTKEGMEEIATEVVEFRGNPVTTGTGEWYVDSATAKIIQPDGREFISAGVNGGVRIGTGGWDGNDVLERSAGWAWERYPGSPNFERYSDIWPGDANIVSGNEIFPGGTVGPGVYWDQANLVWVNLPDRVYALTGHRSQEAIAANILNVDDHWHCRLYRIPALLKHGAMTWTTATWMDSSDTIPQYIDQVDKLERLGLVVSIEDHEIFGTDPTMPASVVANPVLDPNDSSLTGNTSIIDMLKFYDALCLAFPGATRNIWIGLPNETHTTGRTTIYDDWIVTLVKRIRAKGFTGILSLPSGRWAGELANIGRGEYDTLMDRLESHGVGYNLVWEWHNYGARYATPGSGAATDGSYADVDLDLTKCRNGVDGSLRKYAIWMAEYGSALPDSNSATGNPARERLGVDLMTTTIYGSTPLGLKHKHICPAWWSTGSNTFNWDNPLCYGQTNKGNESPTGPSPHFAGNGTTTFSGTYPWWDVTTSALRDEWLTVRGRRHWDLAHLIWQG